MHHKIKFQKSHCCNENLLNNESKINPDILLSFLPQNQITDQNKSRTIIENLISSYFLDFRKSITGELSRIVASSSKKIEIQNVKDIAPFYSALESNLRWGFKPRKKEQQKEREKEENKILPSRESHWRY